MDDLKQSLRAFKAALKTADKGDQADKYADEVEAYILSLKPMLAKVKKLVVDGKRMNLRFETARLEPLEDALDKAIDAFS